MSDPIIQERDLIEADQFIRRLIEQRNTTDLAVVNNDLYGPAFRRYVLFSEPMIPAGCGVPIQTEAVRFYNRYYWFLLFVKLYQARHGFDAGVEQQAFGLLENAGIDIDWAYVEELSRRVEKEAVRLLAAVYK